MIAAIFLISLAATALLAWWRGGPAERSAATMYVIAAIASDIVVLATPHHHAHVETGLALIDTALLVGLAAIAFRTNRWWPIISTALQLMTVMGHVSRALNPNVWRLAYAGMIQASAFPSLLVLAVAILAGAGERSRSEFSQASSPADGRGLRRSPQAD